MVPYFLLRTPYTISGVSNVTSSTLNNYFSVRINEKYNSCRYCYPSSLHYP